MYKRPPLRVRDLPVESSHEKVLPGTFLYSITNPPPTFIRKHVKRPVYMKEVYLPLLEKNCKSMGLEYKEPDIPDYVPRVKANAVTEPILGYAEQVYLKLRVLKSGVIRVKLDASFATIYEKYYSKQKIPPIKTSIQAYKSMGFSDTFIEKIKKKCDSKVAFGKKVSGIIDSIFNKEPAKKPKNIKKKEDNVEVEVEEEEEDEQDPDDVQPEEDEALDMEVDEDLEEQAQEDEEAYLSD